ncbi:hypothetical protein [Moheibacter lacus]|uniref:Right handed beta helix region n=1 Tax=Moheibacter lacus TaxID=2745851 RepID=A0A838ZPR5_9FLAO|nr:hypothetical protein [Moheibacter lacus]MBA5628885.1 hypothetical protein [Moheibacter lacus]
MKKLSSLAVLSLMAMSTMFVSCSGDDDNGGGSSDDDGGDENTIVVSENITQDAIWETGKTYVLAGRIAVVSGAHLEIQPGVVVKGEMGEGADASALIIARGATIDAEGEPNLPIIFTSVGDEITPEQVASGDFSSPNLSSTTSGLWGGLIVLGNARISASAETVGIEGIPASDPNGLYGGTNDTESSGTLRYISIRYSGTDIGEGNEIQGLTLGGVGSGTVVENIEIVGSADDGIEWFGGKVNVTNVVVWNCGDDGIDTDQSWSGTLNNFAVIGAQGHAFELDGPEGSSDYGPHTIQNGFIKMSTSDFTTQDIINTDENSNVNLSNLYFTDLVEGQIINRIDAANVSFNNIYLNTTADDLINRIPEGSSVPSWLHAGTTYTFNGSSLNWTWAAQANQF